MITIIEALIILLLAFMINVKNPVKMSITVLASGSAILLLSCSITGIIWINLILFLLFIGGILVVFIIISSVTPNERGGKVKRLLFLPYFMIGLCFTPYLWTEGAQTSTHIKSVLIETRFLMMMVIVISLYFFIFIKILARREIRLRTFL